MQQMQRWKRWLVDKGRAALTSKTQWIILTLLWDLTRFSPIIRHQLA